ncbi:MAG: acylphosphatase [Nitriliruptorales bacterium]
MSAIARRLRVHGRVQGVFFRASTRDRARRAGASGWVRNCADGSVELWLEGDPDAVAEVEDWVREGGPKAARVEQVEAEDSEPEGFESFDVRS